MPKNWLEADKEKEPEYFRHLNELFTQGKSIMEHKNSKSDQWCSISRKMGLRAKDLIEKEYLLPPMGNNNPTHRHKKAFITYPNVNMERKKITKTKFRFSFFKK